MGPAQKLGKRGVYLLPNLLTTAALFAGFYSIIAGIKGNFDTAAIAVIIAGLLDGLDGRVARMTNTQSDFGQQFDNGQQAAQTQEAQRVQQVQAASQTALPETSTGGINPSTPRPKTHAEYAEAIRNGTYQPRTR